jgi:hypothetical protein
VVPVVPLADIAPDAFVPLIDELRGVLLVLRDIPVVVLVGVGSTPTGYLSLLAGLAVAGV